MWRFWRSGGARPNERAVAVIPRILLLLMLALPWLVGASWAQGVPAEGNAQRAMAAAARLRDSARAAACAPPADVLQQILCSGRMTVGLRTFYPGFSLRNERGEFEGFEPDIARRIAAFLGVELAIRAVDPKSRIPMLEEGRIDLTIATMGHSVQRDGEVRFIRPHYYQSETAVVGPVASPVHEWDSLAGRTVCIPLGANTNIMFVRNHVRILTFERPEQLVDALRFNECQYVAHDDTFFAGFLADPGWTALYGIKFTFAQLPWGMAVAHKNTARWAGLLDALSMAFHVDGTFERLAAAHKLRLAYFADEHARLADPGCLTADGMPAASCLAPPVDLSDSADASPLAPYVARIEQALAAQLGISVDLSLLSSGSKASLLAEGIGYSIALIISTQASTLAFALGLGWLMVGRGRAIRLVVRIFTALGQVTPLPLLMFFVYVIAGSFAHYSGPIALAAAVFAIGLYNGSNAARAIDEANRARAGGEGFRRAVGLAGVQLVSFLINAAKGSPAAGMIGVPEFLNVMTDLTANSRDRTTMQVILLVFYVILVLVVIRLLTMARMRMQRGAARE